MAEIAPFPRETAPLGPVESFAVDQIEVVDRLRPVDADWAAFIASELNLRGLRTPIWVRRLPGGRQRLVVGAHRLAAARLLGWEVIPGHTFHGDADAARAWEIAENLVRRDLDVLSRAAFTAELYELERKRIGWEDGRSAHANAAQRRWAKDASASFAKASDLEAVVAAKVGLGERSIRLQLELFRGLDPRARALLAGHAMAGNAAQLRLLARQPTALQVRIAEQLAIGEVRTVAEAIAAASPRAAADPAKKRLSAFLGAWSRMSVHERRQAIEELPLPRGVTLQVGGRA